MQTTRVVVVAVAIAVLVAGAGSAGARAGGIGGRAAVGCTPCHGPSPGATVDLQGPPGPLLAGERGVFRVTVGGGPGAGAGFNARLTRGDGVPAGSLVVTDAAHSQAVPGLEGEITHTGGNTALTWEFEWSADDPGTYQLEAAAVSANLDGSPGGDVWGLATPLPVEVRCTPQVARACGSGVGACRPGIEVCLEDGSAFGECTGGVEPAQELCDGLDNDCDGTADDACGLCATPEPMTLGPASVVAPRKAGRGRVRLRSHIVAPGPLDPAAVPLTLLLQRDGERLLEASLPAGSLTLHGGRWTFRQKAAGGALGRGSVITVRRAGGGLGLVADLRGLQLTVEPAAAGLVQWIGLGDACFTGEQTCRIARRTLRCRS